jgi:hypothetical protein
MGDLLYLHRPSVERDDSARISRALGRLVRDAAKLERRRGLRDLGKALRAGDARLAVRKAVAAEKAALRRAEARAAADNAAFDARSRAALDVEVDRLRDRIAAGDAVTRAQSW